MMYVLYFAVSSKLKVFYELFISYHDDVIVAYPNFINSSIIEFKVDHSEWLNAHMRYS